MQTLKPDSNLGRFRLLTLLGRGGMGEVWKAEDPRLGRVVAIKILPPELANPDLRIRFERESKILAALNHPGIAHIYEAGEEIPAGGQSKISFLVMEYIEGRSLAQLLSSGPLTVRNAVRLGRQIAKALSAAHESEIVHRDLKPANIMVTPRNQIKILDFGLARPTGSAFKAGAQTLPDVTTSGMVLGTAAYLSPEQVRGETADIRCDIWAAGCVLYQMLSGRRPFPSDSLPEILAAVLRDDPQNLAEIVDGVPPVVKSLVERCLNKDPGKRPQNAREIAAVLKDAYLQLRQGTGGPDSITENPDDDDNSPPIPLSAETINRYLRLTNAAFPQLVHGNGNPYTELVHKGTKVGLMISDDRSDHGEFVVFVAPLFTLPAGHRSNFYRKLLSLSNGLSGIAQFSIDIETHSVNLVCIRRLSNLDPRQFAQTLDQIQDSAEKFMGPLKHEFGIH
jgi:serine/threonine protein kinase